MAVTLDSVGSIFNTIVTDDYRNEGFFVTLSVRTPNEERYHNTLNALGYDGDVNTESDRNGNVATLITADDKTLALNVFYQGPKPEKPITEGEESEPSEAESDLEN